MLKEVETILLNSGYYIEDEIGNLKDSTCKASKIKIIKFDAIKERFCHKFNTGDYLCSSDILKILNDKNEIHFIEMKRCNGMSADGFFSMYYQTEKNKIRNKNIHSIFILLTLLSTYNINEKFYSYFFHLPYPNKLKIKTYILTDLKDSEMGFIEILTLGTSGITFHDVMAGRIDIINCTTFEKYFNR